MLPSPPSRAHTGGQCLTRQPITYISCGSLLVCSMSNEVPCSPTVCLMRYQPLYNCTHGFWNNRLRLTRGKHSHYFTVLTLSHEMCDEKLFSRLYKSNYLDTQPQRLRHENTPRPNTRYFQEKTKGHHGKLLYSTQDSTPPLGEILGRFSQSREGIYRKTSKK